MMRNSEKMEILDDGILRIDKVIIMRTSSMTCTVLTQGTLRAHIIRNIFKNIFKNKIKVISEVKLDDLCKIQ